MENGPQLEDVGTIFESGWLSMGIFQPAKWRSWASIERPFQWILKEAKQRSVAKIWTSMNNDSFTHHVEVIVCCFIVCCFFFCGVGVNEWLMSVGFASHLVALGANWRLKIEVIVKNAHAQQRQCIPWWSNITDITESSLFYKVRFFFRFSALRNIHQEISPISLCANKKGDYSFRVSSSIPQVKMDWLTVPSNCSFDMILDKLSLPSLLPSMLSIRS